MLRKSILKKASLLVCILLFACGGGDGGGGGEPTGDLVGVSVINSSSVGSYTPSITPSVGDDGALRFTLAGVDLGGDGNILTPEVTNVSAVVNTTASASKSDTGDQITCDSGRGIGDKTADLFDIGICLDTTSSMGGAAGVLANKIAQFSSNLASQGVDGKFYGITMGDSFSTKAGSSAYTDPVSKGTLGTPATFGQESERPDTGLTALLAGDMVTFFSEVEAVVGSGYGGGDAAENYLGCINFMNNNALWRGGANRIIISVGDSCSHTDTSQSFIVGPTAANEWSPPSGAAMESALKGVATVHVVGPASPSCSGGTYDMEKLSFATGGTFAEIGDCSTQATCNVDLTTLPIEPAITGGVVYLCDGRLATYGGSGRYVFTLSTRVISGGGTVNNAVTTMELELLFL